MTELTSCILTFLVYLTGVIFTYGGCFAYLQNTSMTKLLKESGSTEHNKQWKELDRIQAITAAMLWPLAGPVLMIHTRLALFSHGLKFR